MANENARALRKRMTSQEVRLWVKLRALKGLGHHSRRQAPIRPYIADFVILRANLIIEIDEGQHGLPPGISADARRDAFFRAQGFRIMRFWNVDVDRHLDGVVERIIAALQNPTLALRADPLHKGEG